MNPVQSIERAATSAPDCLEGWPTTMLQTSSYRAMETIGSNQYPLYRISWSRIWNLSRRVWASNKKMRKFRTTVKFKMITSFSTVSNKMKLLAFPIWTRAQTTPKWKWPSLSALATSIPEWPWTKMILSSSLNRKILSNSSSKFNSYQAQKWERARV